MKYQNIKNLLKKSTKLFAQNDESKKIESQKTPIVKNVLKTGHTLETVIFAFGFNLRKRAFLEKYNATQKFVFIPTSTPDSELDNIKQQISSCPQSVVIWAWGMRLPAKISSFARRQSIKIQYIDEGFISSDCAGEDKIFPYSLCIDGSANHYECGKTSDLEKLLSSYDFDMDPELANRSKAFREKLIDSNVGKHKSIPDDKPQSKYGKKNKKRVLVIGQLENDVSIKHGSGKVKTNAELLALACHENPDAQIIYKAPIHGAINKSVDNDKLEKLLKACLVINENLPNSALFDNVDHVYDIVSISGFEALIRGIKVTTLGSPFYAGWGLTDDRQPNLRRSRKLTIDQLVAGAYLLYPRYYHPQTGRACTPEQAVDALIAEHHQAVKKKAEQVAMAKNKPGNVKSVPKKSTDETKAIAASPDNKNSEKPASSLNAEKAVATPVTPAKKETTAVNIPDWFNPYTGRELKSAIADNKKIYLYIPWIAEHTESLIDKINKTDDYVLLPFDMVSGIRDNEIRRQVSRFARENPALYRQMIVRRLAPLRNQICGVVFTFDWAAAMRIISSVCMELDIPRILVPHESVFVDRSKYYWDITGQASLPAADVMLGWGSLQREIFSERGYPEQRMHVVGAPKFDTYKNYQSYLTREQFCRLHGLDPDKKIILFAAQPLDSQLDQAMARASQREAIKDLITYTAEHDLQLLIRTPPSKDVIINMALRQLIDKYTHVAIDNALCYMVTAEETLYHCDVITSINSTMLFEGLLLGKPAISMKYVEFDQIWQKVGIPAVRSYNELQQLLNEISANNWVQSGIDFSWASSAFGIGEFDGQAATRISAYLSEFAVQPPAEFSQNKPLTRLFNGETVDVVGIPSAAKTLETIQRYLKSLLGARTIVPTQGEIENSTICSVDIFFQWGITPNPHKQQQAKLAKSLGKPVVIIEDGFIRSLDIGLSGESGLSIMLDDITAYYDATKISRLSRLLQDGRALSNSELDRSLAAIEKIVATKVSKYNHAPAIAVKIGTPGRRKILLIDQRFGDQSVSSGLADEHTFNRMLLDAINNNPDCDIIIKQHPDAIKGGKSSYYSNERLAFTQHMDHIYLVNYDINPYSLLELVDEVYVATSGMGFEALMAGKKVHCYGMPFYAGWGLTEDQITLPSRTRNRSLPEVFYFAYIELSRYFDPDQNCVVGVEGIVDYISKHRGW